MRDDPYYLIDDRPLAKKPDINDVDSIPVVRLDNLPPPSSGTKLIPVSRLEVTDAGIQRNNHDFLTLGPRRL